MVSFEVLIEHKFVATASASADVTRNLPETVWLFEEQHQALR